MNADTIRILAIVVLALSHIAVAVLFHVSGVASGRRQAFVQSSERFAEMQAIQDRQNALFTHHGAMRAVRAPDTVAVALPAPDTRPIDHPTDSPADDLFEVKYRKDAMS